MYFLEIFLGIAVISIPVMLLVKPFVLRHKAARGEHVHIHGAEEGAEFNFGDAMVSLFKKYVYLFVIFRYTREFTQSSSLLVVFRIPHLICVYGR